MAGNKNKTMKTKHTPGPWRINHWSKSEEPGITYKGNINGVHFYAGDAVPYPIYGIRNGVIHHADHSLSASFEGAHIAEVSAINDEAEANAKLIAAAPELLESLQQFVSECIVIDETSEFFEVKNKAIAAIKKATE